MSTDPHDGWTPQPQEQEQPRESYNASQRLAIGSDAPVTVVTAGPGSGKSHTIIGRILHGPSSPRSTLVVTYTTNASKVLKRRLAEQGVEVGFAGTVHSFLFTLIKRYSAKLGYGEHIGILDAEAAEALLTKTATEHRYTGSKESLTEELKRGPVLNPKSKSELVCSAFWRKMMESNVLDFNTIIRNGTLLLHDPVVISEWRWESLCWDEFQDASDQYQAVFNAIPAKWKIAVGDPKQSVFGFLGANVANIIQIASAGAAVIPLAENYRCCEEVCATANRLILANPAHEETVSATGAHGTVKLFEASDEKKEACVAANRIHDLQKEKPDCTTAVLVMTHAHRQQMETLLEGFGVTVEKREDAAPPRDWKQVRALLNALSDPDNVLFAEALVRTWKPEQAEKIISAAIEDLMGLNEACLHLPHLQSAKSAVEFIAAKQPTPEALKRLQDALDTLADNGESTIQDLQMALVEQAEQKNVVKAGSVQVMTYWAAKGGEWDNVFLPGLEEELLPPKSYTATEALIQECRRVLYVGVTRARTHLFLSWAATRRSLWTGKLDLQERSRYLAEMNL